MQRFAILAIIFGFTNQSEKRYHQTVQKLIESGQTLNEEALSGIPGYQKKTPRDDLRTGALASATGLGIFFLGLVALGDVVLGVGLLVMCIGAALFAFGYMNKDNNNDSSD